MITSKRKVKVSSVIKSGKKQSADDVDVVATRKRAIV